MAALKFANITVCATYMVLLAGDIQENPGPVTDACAVCTKGCRKNQMAIQCDSCDKWFHAKCISMKRTEYDKLCEPSLAWECITCLSPGFDTPVRKSHETTNTGVKEGKPSVRINKDLHANLKKRENSGPDQNVDNQTRLSVDSTTLLNFRLGQLGLRALDVGGAGDCFFRAVSHQLYGNPNSHFRIRQAAVHYLRHNPERFIESNTQNSWNGYLTIMSMQGTWCDALTVQAVAESLNIQIYIIESNVNFGQVTLIQPHHPSQQQPRTIYIGHVDEIHYVSTVPNSSCSGNEHCNNKYYNINNFTKQNVLSEQVQKSS